MSPDAPTHAESSARRPQAGSGAHAAGSVLIVDDHPLFRHGVAAALAGCRDLEVVAEAGSGDDCIRLATSLDPDLILLDLRMKGLDGVETLRGLREAGSQACVLILSGSENPADVERSLQAGADRYLSKDIEAGELSQQVRGALARCRMSFRRSSVARTASPKLTRAISTREAAVLERLSLGLTNKAIARQLHIAEGTVKVHIRNMKRKLGCDSRLELAVWFLQRND
ncbi:MAG: response regulator transcription factor [Rhodocyclaceae bacterium]|nr:response regulator transcription factor [Rhodocyclaceae bacterium]